MSNVTEILSKLESGDEQASEALLPLVYQELRKLAAAKLAQEKPGQTLQATALVHEAYIKLVGGADSTWDSRGHFFAAAAEAMRRILVDNARRKKAEKHGGNHVRLDVFTIDPAAAISDDEILALHDALEKLAEIDSRKAQLIKLRFFAGMTNEDAAKALGISASTAYSDWAYARAWLRLETSS